ncbi:hypothetical protein P12x_006002 (plasmid) [Tundrisphaera lichenicola]|uniref:hypothetical protein n=1 Tax=Tundrisphaera lichenicola TaxID=2029860 RepID=UPI003EB8BF85
MISDILRDALAEIDRYLGEYPDLYAGHAERIGRVKLEMEGLRATLVQPRVGEECGCGWSEEDHAEVERAERAGDA